METTLPHIGKLVQERMAAKDKLQSDFGVFMKMSQSGISRLLSKSDWYASDILSASIFLHENIFSYLSGSAPPGSSMVMEGTPIYRVKSLSDQLSDCRERKTMAEDLARALKEINDSLKKRNRELEIELNSLRTK